METRRLKPCCDNPAISVTAWVMLERLARANWARHYEDEQMLVEEPNGRDRGEPRPRKVAPDAVVHDIDGLTISCANCGKETYDIEDWNELPYEEDPDLR